MSPKTTYRVPISFPLEIPKLQEVDEASNRKNMTRSAYIRMAIDEQLKRDRLEGV